MKPRRRARPGTSSSWATRTSRSTAGAGPTSRTSSSSRASSRRRRRSASSATTARRRRSSKAAGAVVAENRRRLGKTLRATKKGGENVRLVVFDEERDEAREVVSRIAAARRATAAGPRSRSSSGRTRSPARSRTSSCARTCPYILVGGTKFYERAEIKDALAYLRLAAEPVRRRVLPAGRERAGARRRARRRSRRSRPRPRERGVSLLAALDALPDGMTERAKKALAEFRDLVAGSRDFGAAEGNGAGAAVAFALEETGLLEALRELPRPAGRGAPREPRRAPRGGPRARAGDVVRRAKATTRRSRASSTP